MAVLAQESYILYILYIQGPYILYILCIQACSHTSPGRIAASFRLSKSDTFPAEAVVRRKETLLLWPHAACFTELDAAGIGLRTQGCVIRGMFSQLARHGARTLKRVQDPGWITCGMAISRQLSVNAWEKPVRGCNRVMSQEPVSGP